MPVAAGRRPWRGSTLAPPGPDPQRVHTPYLSSHGAWRSLVARLLWEQEVPGSNPGAPMAEWPAPEWVSVGPWLGPPAPFRYPKRSGASWQAPVRGHRHAARWPWTQPSTSATPSPSNAGRAQRSPPRGRPRWPARRGSGRHFGVPTHRGSAVGRGAGVGPSGVQARLHAEPHDAIASGWRSGRRDACAAGRSKTTHSPEAAVSAATSVIAPAKPTASATSPATSPPAT